MSASSPTPSFSRCLCHLLIYVSLSCPQKQTTKHPRLVLNLFTAHRDTLSLRVPGRLALLAVVQGDSFAFYIPLPYRSPWENCGGRECQVTIGLSPSAGVSLHPLYILSSGVLSHLISYRTFSSSLSLSLS